MFRQAIMNTASRMATRFVENLAPVARDTFINLSAEKQIAIMRRGLHQIGSGKRSFFAARMDGGWPKHPAGNLGITRQQRRAHARAMTKAAGRQQRLEARIGKLRGLVEARGARRRAEAAALTAKGVSA